MRAALAEDVLKAVSRRVHGMVASSAAAAANALDQIRKYRYRYRREIRDGQ